MINEIPWREFGNALGNKFMIAWRMFDGFVQDMARKNDAGITGWQELGNAVAEAMKGMSDKVDLHTGTTNCVLQNQRSYIRLQLTVSL